MSIDAKNNNNKKNLKNIILEAKKIRSEQEKGGNPRVFFFFWGERGKEKQLLLLVMLNTCRNYRRYPPSYRFEVFWCSHPEYLEVVIKTEISTSMMIEVPILSIKTEYLQVFLTC